jgi:Tfp pilus assembly protein PilF
MSIAFTRSCQLAMELIRAGDYAAARYECHRALHFVPNRRAWSKIMLAIRELSRIAPEREGTAQQL